MTMPRKPLRLWPGIVIVALQLLLRFVVPTVAPSLMAYGLLGSLACTPLLILWWLFFSRAAWLERLTAPVLMVAAMFGASRIIDKSIAGGAMGFLFPMLALPVLCASFVAWAIATRGLSDGVRRATMAAAIVLAAASPALIRTGGFDSSFKQDLHWRWTASAEERLVAQSRNVPPPTPPPPP